LKVDLALPDFENEGKKKVYSILFDLETIQKIANVFEEYEDIKTYCDGSSLRNPGFVRFIFRLNHLVWISSRPHGSEKECD
jgi:hypothetical protein